MAGFFILLPRQVLRQAADAAGLIRRDLQRILESDELRDLAVWQARSSRQILRLSLHLGRAPGLGKHWPKGLLAAINLGQAILDLRQSGLPESVRALLSATLQRQLSPGSAAESLLALAQRESDGCTKAGLLNLAWTLEQSSDLLRFGLPGGKPESTPAPGA